MKLVWTYFSLASSQVRYCASFRLLHPLNLVATNFTRITGNDQMTAGQWAALSRRPGASFSHLVEVYLRVVEVPPEDQTFAQPPELRLVHGSLFIYFSSRCCSVFVTHSGQNSEQGLNWEQREAALGCCGATEPVQSVDLLTRLMF